MKGKKITIVLAVGILWAAAFAGAFWLGQGGLSSLTSWFSGKNKGADMASAVSDQNNGTNTVSGQNGGLGTASDQEQANSSGGTLTYISHMETGDGNEISAVYDFDISYNDETGLYVSSAYDENGNVLLTYKYRPDGKMIEKSGQIYLEKITDENGSRDHWDLMGTEWNENSMWMRYFVDSQGEYIGTIQYWNGSYSLCPMIYFYDENGQEAGFIETDYGDVYHSGDYAYDGNGHFLKIDNASYTYDSLGNGTGHVLTNSDGEIIIQSESKITYSTIDVDSAAFEAFAADNQDGPGYPSFEKAVEAIMEYHSQADIDKMVQEVPENLSEEISALLEATCYLSADNAREDYRALLTKYFPDLSEYTDEYVKEELTAQYQKYLEGDDLESALSDAAMSEALERYWNLSELGYYLCPSEADIYHTGIVDDSTGERGVLEYDGYEIMYTTFYSLVINEDVNILILHDETADLYYPIMQIDLDE